MNIYVVVGISNSVLSILTANFPVRIEKKEVCMIALNLTGMFSVSIKKTEFAWVFSILTANFSVRIKHLKLTS